MHPIRPWLFIGKFSETQDDVLLRRREIGAMLQLADSVKQPGIPSLYVPVEDGEPLPPDLLRMAAWPLPRSTRTRLETRVQCHHDPNLPLLRLCRRSRQPARRLRMRRLWLGHLSPAVADDRSVRGSSGHPRGDADGLRRGDKSAPAISDR